MVDVIVTDFSRVFLMPGRAAPTSVPIYEGFWKAGAVAWKQGDPKTIKIPSGQQYKQFQVVGKMPGDQGDPEITIRARATTDLSALLAICRGACDNDLQIHIGQCGNPQDFNGGWEKILVLEGAGPTNYGIADLGALQPSESALVEEEVPFIGENLYEIKHIVMAQQGASVSNQEVLDIHVCDSVACGACGLTSDGCQVVFAIMKSLGGSPGLGSELLYTSNGGATWNRTRIMTLPIADDPNHLTCVGVNVFVTSQADVAVHYAAIADVVAGAPTWARNAAGLVVGGAPRAIYAPDPIHCWIAGAGGYIYFTQDPTATFGVQDAGGVTTQAYNAISGSDNDNLVAVGALNAVAFTNNGGLTWAPVLGPAVGVALNTVAVVSRLEWWVGAADGNLYFTLNGGATWGIKAFPGSAAGSVTSVVFVTPTVGYMAQTVAGKGRVLRTISGGNSWYLAPEGSALIPANAGIDALAVCGDANIVFGAGLATGGLAGFVFKGE